MADDVFDRIREALSGKPSAAEIEAVMAATRSAIADQAVWRAELEAVARDPLVSTKAADKAADDVVRCSTTTNRLKAALDRLEPVHAAALHAEHQARLAPAYEKARAARDTLIEEFCAEYGKHARAVAGLLGRMRDMDHKTLDGLQAPAGCEALDSCRSLIGRSFIDLVRLPELQGGGFLWGNGPAIPMANALQITGQRSEVW